MAWSGSSPGYSASPDALIDFIESGDGPPQEKMARIEQMQETLLSLEVDIALWGTGRGAVDFEGRLIIWAVVHGPVSSHQQ